MKNARIFSLAALALIAGMIFACGGGSSSSAQPASDDDSSPADDDLSPGSATVQNVTQSACLGGGSGKDDPFDPTTQPIDVVLPSWDNGVLKIANLNAYANCNFALAPTVDASGTTVTITESGTGSAVECNCPFTFNYEIHGVNIPTATLVVQRQDLDQTSPAEIFRLELPLGSENKKWVLPLVEGFFAGDASAKPFQAKYAGCNYYHYNDAVFMVRQDQNMRHVFSYDWVDLDNPGNYDPTCHLPVAVTIGTLAAGSYHLGAPSFNVATNAWSMKTFDATIP